MSRLPAALALLLATTPALARLPAELTGHGKLRFGMSPEQAQQVIGPARCWMGNQETLTRCQREGAPRLAGLPAAWDLHFLHGRLFRIVVDLQLPPDAAWPAFSARFDEVRDLLVARHGKPDEEQGDVMIDLASPRRAATWRGPGRATELSVTASAVVGPASLQVAWVDAIALATLGAATGR